MSNSTANISAYNAGDHVPARCSGADAASVRASLLWSCLQVLNRERHEALMRAFGTLESAARHIDGELLRGLGCRTETAGSVLKRMEMVDVEQEVALMASIDAQIVTLGDDSYSQQLADIPDAPVFLYILGDASVLSQPCIALVGTRKMSAYGRRCAQEFARGVTQAGMVTVSGLARGIDAQVAEETISVHGRTVAVMGQGLLTLNPSPKNLADRIVAAGGLIMSEFPLRMGPDMFTFPMRNRIIAGLSMATVVLEAPESSGALITAKLAFDYGREVFAVPGQIFDCNYAGCHAIIRKNQARIAVSPRGVLQELGVVVPDDADQNRVSYLPQNPDEEKVLKHLSSMPQNIDDLTGKSAMTAGSLSAVLTVLELNGAARNLGQGQWIRVQ